MTIVDRRRVSEVVDDSSEVQERGDGKQRRTKRDRRQRWRLLVDSWPCGALNDCKAAADVSSGTNPDHDRVKHRSSGGSDSVGHEQWRLCY